MTVDEGLCAHSSGAPTTPAGGLPNAQPGRGRSWCYTDETGASPVCQHQRQVFSSASIPHLPKRMALITALPPFFIFEHTKKDFYLVNPKHIL